MPAPFAEGQDISCSPPGGKDFRARFSAEHISDFSKTTTLGNWSADILVRSRSSVNPEADRNVR